MRMSGSPGTGSGSKRLPWAEQVEADRAAVSAAQTGSAASGQIALAVARLLDTSWRNEADALVKGMSPADRARHAGFAYAEGVLAGAAGATDEAIQWLTRAQSTLRHTEIALGARVAFELGYIYAARGERHVADSVLAWGRGLGGALGSAPADVIHLEALMETLAGNHAAARPLYDQVVAGSADALTPRSRVLALSNWAVSLTHTHPLESVHLSGLALATHRSHALHARAEPAMQNILGYALICCGLLSEARRVLQSVVLEASATRHEQAELYARFNLAIIAELQGHGQASADQLQSLEASTSALGFNELAGWCRIRLAWLDLIEGRGAAAQERIQGLSAVEAQLPAVDMVRALMARQLGRLRTASDLLRRLAALNRARADDLSAFACLLWLGVVQEQGGQRTAAARSVNEALASGLERAFRLSPNWWSAELLSVARRLATNELREYAGQLVEPATQATHPPSQSRVDVARDGSLHIDGVEVPAERWRVGRTGSRVLRRLFVALVAAYPSALTRDELTDFMWPESEGDSAVANLYAATNDLRTVLADVPGVALVSGDGAYALSFAANVRIM